MKLQLSEIAQAINGKLIGETLEITGISIDTRTLSSGQLYIAIKGKNFDGHDFVSQAERAGATAILTEITCVSRLPQIIVPNTHLALAELAGYWRNQLPVKVVGVTGSNGKTTVKEMIAAILATQGNTLYTKGNLNNDIGVPLTLMQLANEHSFAVIEMGANHAGEIAYTSRYARADIAVITNVGAAHIEGFGSIENIAHSKGEIIGSLSNAGIAILNHDDTYYPLWLALAGQRKSVSFGLSTQADVYASDIQTERYLHGFETSFALHTGKESIEIKLQLAGEHNVKNALAATAACLQLGIDINNIKIGLEQVNPVTGRMQLLTGRRGSVVIDDTYNANPNSLRAALDVLDKNTDNWLILGAFSELGPDSPTIHAEIGHMIKTTAVNRLYAVGANAEKTVMAFGGNGQYFENQEQLINTLNQAITGKETLLVKGSRSQKMENVVAALVDNYRAA